MAPPPRYSSICVSHHSSCSLAAVSRLTHLQSDSMQKYIQLSSQQDALHRRLSTAAPAGSMSPEQQSTGSSPTHSRSIFTSPWSPEQSYTTTSSNPIPARPSKRHSITDSEDANRLAEINQEIKATLTELLNTTACRTDAKYRQWVQGRLMDVEHEIRQRRRRSSALISDKEFASSVAEGLEFNIPAYKAWE